MSKKNLIRFDWAMKKLLRNKANFDIVEGFLSELLREDIVIKQILDSESNKEDEKDKHNRVDILVENSKGELIIIEVQNSQEYDYFQRMLYGTSKAITEHIDEGHAYSSIKKVISITIAYFDLGQGKDYVYHGTTVFKGIHNGDIMALSERQIEVCKQQEVFKIYPEYWVIKVDTFDGLVKDKLDEWIYFFKNSEIKNDFTAKGLKEANEKLGVMKLSEKERRDYDRYLKELRDKASANLTIEIDTKYSIREAVLEEREKKDTEFVLRLVKQNLDVQTISLYTGLSQNKVKEIIEKHSKS